MKTYTITRVTGKPDWSGSPALELTEPLKTPSDPVPVRAWTQVACNEQALLIRQWAQEPDIRAEHTGRYDPVCEDSCLEFFFSPVEGDKRYFNIEYNPNASYYLGFGSPLGPLHRLTRSDGVDGFQARTARSEGGWELTYQIPYAFIRQFFPEFDPAPGRVIRANCYKCGDLTACPHWLSWNPVIPRVTGMSFHQPEYFGQMTFG